MLTEQVNPVCNIFNLFTNGVKPANSKRKKFIKNLPSPFYIMSEISSLYSMIIETTNESYHIQMIMISHVAK